MNRRLFLYETAILSSLPILNACSPPAPVDDSTDETSTPLEKTLKISLAQWSLHRQIEAKETDPNRFAAVARRTYGIGAVEYVNQFYVEHVNNESFWNEMQSIADQEGVQSLLIMVDNEGDLGASNEEERIQAVENHYKWVHAAKLLGCHSIRVNAFGAEDEQVFRSALADGMGRLASYARDEGIQVIIENHGLYSSNAALITDVIKQVNLPNFGTFPDFGNWCQSAKWGSTMIPCETNYGNEQGLAEFLPYAKAVSAKSYNFDSEGNQTQLDYPALLKLVKDSDYDGYIGIEYEGDSLSEHEGILATKALMERIWPTLA
ncbi:MAG: sugar phosphate isomerase/epimerase family protein [Bacteroidota bacterium]